ncbi:hypothetical protein IG631_21675 [Alternaria alternata]|nr:hypothetical protein IG631_21675 [Alternaria alternata]
MRFRTEAVLQPSFPERLSGFVAALPGHEGGRARERLAGSVASVALQSQTDAHTVRRPPNHGQSQGVRRRCGALDG